MKTLYTFSINQEIEVEKVETREDNGQIVTTKTKVKEQKPIQFSIKKPSKNEADEADIFRAATLHDYIKRGVMPQALLAKTYDNNGGTLSQVDIEYDQTIRRQLTDKNEELLRLKVAEPENRTAIDQVLRDIITLQNAILSFNDRQNMFYADTAEFKAKTRYIEYMFINFVYFDPKGDGKFEQYFKGKTFEEKIKSLELLEENEEAVFAQVRDKALFVISLYMHLGSSLKSEDIEKLINSEAIGV